jgi:O-antigen ligase
MRMEEMFFVAHPHNMYMQVYMDMGIIGTVLVIWFWMISLRGFWRLSGDERLVPEMQGFFEGAAVGLVAFFIAGIAGSSLFPTPEQSYLWLALGMMWGVKKHLARLPAPEPKPKASPESPPPTYNPRPFGAS